MEMDRTKEKAFREVKSCLTRAPVMAYFQHGIHMRIVMDVSHFGLGVILEQKQSNGEDQPVYYASCKLTDTKSLYSQFKREALRVYWGAKSSTCISLGSSLKYSQTTNR